MRNNLVMQFVVKLLLLLSLAGGVTFAPAPGQAHTTATQMASVHRYPDCPSLPCA